GIQAPSWCARRIQPQVYVWTDGFAWRIVRYASESRARDLSQFFPAGDAVAVHRNPSGNLKGFSGFSSRDGNCDRKLSVLDIRHEFVSCDLRSFAPLGGNLPNAEQVTSPNRNRIKPHPFGTSFARRRSAMAHESSSPRSSNEIAMSLTCKCFISIESKITPRPPGCDLVGIIIAALWYKIRLNDKLKGNYCHEKRRSQTHYHRRRNTRSQLRVLLHCRSGRSYPPAGPLSNRADGQLQSGTNCRAAA